MVFPNTRQVASFEPSSQAITLNEITKVEIQSAWDEKRYGSLRQPLSTIYHELTHWADTVGTLWGNNYLKKVYNAYDVLPSIHTPGSEIDFHKFLTVHDQERRLSLSEYYRLQHPGTSAHGTARTWRLEFSSGLEFNSDGHQDDRRPILFVKFSDRSDGTPVVRQPLCVAALLETTATYSELTTQAELIKLIEGDERKLEEYLMNKEFVSRLYAEDLTLYTAPVHLLAHYASITDAALAYRLGALISLVCLNLTGSHFRKLRPPASMSQWSNRFTAFKNIGSIPFAYFCICAHGQRWKEGMTPLSWVEDALELSNLPSFNEILANAARELATDNQYCRLRPFRDFQLYMRELGSRWVDYRRERIDAAVSPHHLQDKSLVTPPMFDANCEPVILFESSFDTKRFDPVLMFDVEAKLRTQIRNFKNACR